MNIDDTNRRKKMDRETQNKLLEEFDAIAWKLAVEDVREIVGQFRYYQFIEDKKDNEND